MRAPSAAWTSWKCTVLLSVAGYSFTGTLTSPKVTVPFHSERAMPCPLPVRARAHAGGAGSLPAGRGDVARRRVREDPERMSADASLPLVTDAATGGRGVLIGVDWGGTKI